MIKMAERHKYVSPAFLLFGGYRLCDFISIERILSHSVGEKLRILSFGQTRANKI